MSSPIDAEPHTNEKKTRGTTNNFKEITKIFPITSKILSTIHVIKNGESGSDPPSRLKIKPTIMPALMPRRILVDNCTLITFSHRSEPQYKARFKFRDF